VAAEGLLPRFSAQRPSGLAGILHDAVVAYIREASGEIASVADVPDDVSDTSTVRPHSPNGQGAGSSSPSEYFDPFHGSEEAPPSPTAYEPRKGKGK
jgi:hypothetical protein